MSRRVVCDTLFVEDTESGVESPVADDSPKWGQVAADGEFKGYAGGELPFAFTRKTFDQIIANFRSHPSFKRDANGVGCADVVAWDFHHASEMSASEGSIPVTGTPAQGWIVDLATRDNPETKRCELWALTRWLEPAKTYIKEKRYRWASVSVVFDAVDPVSSKNVGALLTSVALTNNPFIEGMAALTAERRPGNTGVTRKLDRFFKEIAMYLNPACSPLEALDTLRRILALPGTADLASVLAEVEKLRQWVATDSTPTGVNVTEYVDAMRVLFNLPALASTAEIFAEVDKLSAAFSDNESSPESEIPTLDPKEASMTFLATLAATLGVVATEAAVIESIESLSALRAASAAKLSLDQNTATKVVLKATLDDAGVRAKFGPLLKALGVEDPEAALDRVAKLMQEAEEMKVVAPELTSLRQRVAEMDVAEEEIDIEEAMASMKISKSSENFNGIRLAVEHYRKAKGREEFFKRYPKPAAGQSYLTRNVAASQSSAAAAGSQRSDSQSATDQIDVSHYSGHNLMLKTVEFVKCSVTGADKWGWDKLHEHASSLVRSNKVRL